MSGKDEDDPNNFWLPPDEMWVTAEELSVMMIGFGLQNADIRPLAVHLREGYPIPAKIAGMIADAIEGIPGSVCSISASRPNAGNPHERSHNLHTRNVKIGFAYMRELQSAKRGGAKRIRCEIAKRFHVSEATVGNAVAYTRRWLGGLAERPALENDQ